jgi:hypothetical protein
MIDRRVAEEILNKAAQAVSETSFGEFNARYLAVNLELTPVLELAALTQDQEVRRLNGRASVLPCAGPSWRYALVQTPAQYTVPRFTPHRRVQSDSRGAGWPSGFE